ncbi:hypothetical protein G7054_g14370 [Neopestalotiopsis clavispora]|nr:hypothetical protein G7054_g14370 [Neopestalotiopsis clavispora]
MFSRPAHSALIALAVCGLFVVCDAKKKTAKKLGSKVGHDLVGGIPGALVDGVITLAGNAGRKRHTRLEDRVSERDIYARDDEPWTAPAGVPQYNFDMCAEDLSKTTIHVQGPVSNNGVRIDNLPPTCMVLSAVIDGDADGGPTPIPCGNACILYDNLNAADYQEMYQIFLDYPKGS